MSQHSQTRRHHRGRVPRKSIKILVIPLKSQLRVGSDKNHGFHAYSMEIVLCMRPISEENAIKKVSEVVQNDTEASCDLWFAFLTGIFIGNRQKTIQFKDQCLFFLCTQKMDEIQL